MTPCRWAAPPHWSPTCRLSAVGKSRRRGVEEQSLPVSALLGPCPWLGAHQASGSARDGCQVVLASSVPFVRLCTSRLRCWASALPPVHVQANAHGNDCGCRYRSLPGRCHSAGPPVTAKGPRPAQTFIHDLMLPRILACALLPVPYWRTPRWSCWPTAATPSPT